MLIASHPLDFREQRIVREVAIYFAPRKREKNTVGNYESPVRLVTEAARNNPTQNRYFTFGEGKKKKMEER